jgi:hypothetical protein
VTEAKVIHRWAIIEELPGVRGPSLYKVFIARNLETGTIVALSAVRQEFTDQSGLFDEIQAGVRAYKSLGQGAGIIGDVDCVCETGQLYTTNAYYSGARLLSKWLYDGYVFTEAEIAGIGLQISSALARALDAAVVFGGLCLEGILYDPVSQSAFIVMLPKPPMSLSSVLAVAKGIGNPYYHPPQDILNSKVSAQSDLFSLYLILFALASGRLPYKFSGDFGMACLDVLRKPVPLLGDSVMGVSKSFAAFIDEGLAKGRKGEIMVPQEFRASLSRLQPSTNPIVSEARMRAIAKSNLPFPISFHCSLLWETCDVSFRISQLQSGLTTTMEFLAFLLIAELRSACSDSGDLLARLERPSLGHWLEVLREGGKRLAGHEDGLLCREIVPLLVSRRGRPTLFMDTLEKLVSWRNRRWGHGIQTDEEGTYDTIGEAEGLFQQILIEVLFLSRYRLVVVDALQFRKGRFVTQLTSFRGTAPSKEDALLDKALPCGEALLCSMSLDRYVSLAPYITYAKCPHCGKSDWFLYHSKKDKAAEYFGFHRGHTMEVDWSEGPDES